MDHSPPRFIHHAGTAKPHEVREGRVPPGSRVCMELGSLSPWRPSVKEQCDYGTRVTSAQLLASELHLHNKVHQTPLSQRPRSICSGPLPGNSIPISRPAGGGGAFQGQKPPWGGRSPLPDNSLIRKHHGLILDLPVQGQDVLIDERALWQRSRQRMQACGPTRAPQGMGRTPSDLLGAQYTVVPSKYRGNTLWREP